MFGRRKVPFGSQPPEGFAPPEPARPAERSQFTSGTAGLPFEKVNAALGAAIRLFTAALDQAGRDCGGLAARGEAPPEIAALLADSVVRAGDVGPEFLTLAATWDFVEFSYQPHCRLLLMINTAAMIEDIEDPRLRSRITLSQVPRALIDAHLMKIWIRYVRPFGKVIAAADIAGLGANYRRFSAEIDGFPRWIPDWMCQRVDIRECTREWCAGLPATLCEPLTENVRRVSRLPMTEAVAAVAVGQLAGADPVGAGARPALRSVADVGRGRPSGDAANPLPAAASGGTR